jgi:hypothetical protein
MTLRGTSDRTHPREPRPRGREGEGARRGTAFVYPGVLAMSVLFAAIFSAALIVWGREFQRTG